MLTNAREEPASKLCLTVSTKCVASSLISTNTYSILIPFVESMGTVKVSTEIITLDYSFPNNQSSNPGGGGGILPYKRDCVLVVTFRGLNLWTGTA